MMGKGRWAGRFNCAKVLGRVPRSRTTWLSGPEYARDFSECDF
jgi:hypothetical protein